MSDFGSELKKIRKEKGLSLKEVAKRGNISHSYISQIENGKRNPPKPEIIHKLAIGLDIDSNILMEEAGYIKKDIAELEKEIERMEQEKIQLSKEVIEEELDFLKSKIELQTIETKISVIELLELKNKIYSIYKIIDEITSPDNTYSNYIDVINQIEKKLNKKIIGNIDNYNVDIFTIINKDLDLYYDEILLTDENKRNIIKFIENFIL